MSKTNLYSYRQQTSVLLPCLYMLFSGFSSHILANLGKGIVFVQLIEEHGLLWFYSLFLSFV